MLRSSSVTGKSVARRWLMSSTTTSSSMSARNKTTVFAANSLATHSRRPLSVFNTTTIRSMTTSLGSSFAEPGCESLFEGESGSSASGPESIAAFTPSEATDEDKDTQLRADIRTMGSLLGHIVQDHHGTEIFEKIEELRGLSKKWRMAGAGRTGTDPSHNVEEADATFKQLTTVCSNLNNDEILIIARAFNFFLSIANAAEGHHRIRRLNMATREEALPDRYDSCGGALKSLLEQGHSSDDIYDALISQKVELVLTAHPTEVNRRTILEKQRRVQKILTKADYLRDSSGLSGAIPGTTGSGYAQSELDRSLKREIASTWQTDEVAREKPTPQNEAERGTLVVETVLWEALPAFLRRLNSVTTKTIAKSLPLDASPVIFSSWMGGDRDGNPNVTPDVTREVCLKKRAQAAGLIKRDLIRLKSELSIMDCSLELKDIALDLGGDVSTMEPYRTVLSKVSLVE
jgi:phosphoenolpyruvate carboxylase